MDAENLQQYNNWYDEAAAQVKDNKEVLARVQKARLSVDYASLEAARKGLSDSFSLHKNKAAAEDRLQRFAATTKAEGITSMNEMRYSVQEYIDTYYQTLSRSQSQNLAANKPVTLQTKPKKYANEDPQSLSDGAFGGANFYANWLGFEGNDLEAVVDLGTVHDINSVSSAFLQVVNHIVFLPLSVSYYGSIDGEEYTLLGKLPNPKPLSKDSKINDIQYFNLEDLTTKARFIKISADNIDIAPDWHHGAGLPAWIFVDEVMVEGK